MRVAVGAPIVVDDRRWGVVAAGWNHEKSASVVAEALEYAPEANEELREAGARHAAFHTDARRPEARCRDRREPCAGSGAAGLLSVRHRLT
jgi:hypothetical protein